MFFLSAYSLNTIGCDTLRLKWDIHYLWWPVTMRCYSWNTFFRYGYGYVGQLEMLMYALVSGILMLTVTICAPVGEAKRMPFNTFPALWRECLKVFFQLWRWKQYVPLKCWYSCGIVTLENNVNFEGQATCFA